jgi:hypothetical protein
MRENFQRFVKASEGGGVRYADLERRLAIDARGRTPETVAAKDAARASIPDINEA